MQGIGPVETDKDTFKSEHMQDVGRGGEEDDNGGGGARFVWHVQAHHGAINCIAAHGEFLATASR